MDDNLENYLDNHYIHKSNWLRAAVLGANDGILSTSSLVIGVVAATADIDQIILAGIAGLVAGALSMAAGEYVSVSSQTDIERADIEREKIELEEMPELELVRLTQIYVERGLKPETASQVAVELTQHDALGAHVRDELGINEISEAKPLQAALASGASFTVGGLLPVLTVFFLPFDSLEYYIYAFSILFLALLGAISAKTGGAKMLKPVIRIVFWGSVAMGISAFVGYLFGVAI